MEWAEEMTERRKERLRGIAGNSESSEEEKERAEWELITMEVNSTDEAANTFRTLPVTPDTTFTKEEFTENVRLRMEIKANRQTKQQV